MIAEPIEYHSKETVRHAELRVSDHAPADLVALDCTADDDRPRRDPRGFRQLRFLTADSEKTHALTRLFRRESTSCVCSPTRASA